MTPALPAGQLLAPAKVNLFLQIIGRDARGYHLLESLAVQTAFGDALAVTPLPRGAVSTLRLNGRTIDAPPEANILLRLLDQYNRRFGEDHRLALALDKRIPVAAGLGGGSADAAALLRWLVARDGRSLDDPAVQALALGLGADLPVCLAPVPQLMRGVGEHLTAVALPSLALVLVNPNRPLSTAAVFAARQGAFTPPIAPAQVAALAADPPALLAVLAGLRNDLEPAACRLEPEIGRMLAALRDNGSALARMSGSGASCFGVFFSQKAAQQAAADLTRAYPGWFVTATQSFAAHRSAGAAARAGAAADRMGTE